MASTYSPSLKLTLMGDGDQSGLWGQTTNNNLGTLIEQAITGVTYITMSDANYTLTNFNGVTDESRNAVIIAIGTNNAQRDLIPPVVKKLYTIVNNTTGNNAIRVIGVTGTGVVIPNGTTALVYCDGTNFISGLSGTSGNFSVNGVLTATTANATTINASTVNATTGTFTTLSGNGVALTAINASNITSGTVATARLATSGTANAATFLRGDQTWSTPSSFATANFLIQQIGTSLVFQYNGANVAVMDSGGNLTSAGQFTAGGSV